MTSYLVSTPTAVRMIVFFFSDLVVGTAIGLINESSILDSSALYE